MLQQADFERNASQWRAKAYATARFILRDDETAEDIAQETLLRLWAAKDRLLPEQSIEAYASTVAHHLSISWLRQQNGTIERTTEQMEPIDTRTPEDDLNEDENRRWLQHAIAQIPMACRAILIMSHNEGLSNQTIAKITGYTEASVRAMLSKARRCLFEQLQKHNTI